MLKRKRSTGIDDLPPGIIKDVALQIAGAISCIINLSLTIGVVPSEWKKAKVVHLHKDGDSSDENNYKTSCAKNYEKICSSSINELFTRY